MFKAGAQSTWLRYTLSVSSPTNANIDIALGALPPGVGSLPLTAEFDETQVDRGLTFYFEQDCANHLWTY
jgi:hypothetical protein